MKDPILEIEAMSAAPLELRTTYTNWVSHLIQLDPKRDLMAFRVVLPQECFLERDAAHLSKLAERKRARLRRGLAQVEEDARAERAVYCADWPVGEF